MWAGVHTHGDYPGHVAYADIDHSQFAAAATWSDQISHNAWTDAELPYTIQLNYDEAFSLNYASINPAVVKATQGRFALAWKGPIFALCGSIPSNSRDICTVHDVDMRSYASVIAHMIDRGNTETAHLVRKGPKVRAVKVACAGEQRVSAVHPYEEVMIPRTHPIFETANSIPPISQASYCRLYLCASELTFVL